MENKLNKINSTESYLQPAERIQQSQVLTVFSCCFICLDRQECQLFRRELFCKVLRYHVQSCLNKTSPQTRNFTQTGWLKGSVGPWQVYQQRGRLLTPAESASRAGTTFLPQETDGNVQPNPSQSPHPK